MWEWIKSLFAKKVEAPVTERTIIPVPPLAKAPAEQKMNPVDWTKLDEGSPAFYRAAFAVLQTDKGYEKAVERAGKIWLASKERYISICRIMEWPEKLWWMIAGMHWRESSCNFAGCLHNGEHIIGNGKKTTLVPANRGPFNTWEEAAIDALSMNASRWKFLREGITDIGFVLRALESYNGTGYISGSGRQDTTPYLWADSSINDDYGYYSADGHYDPKKTANSYPGIATVAKWLQTNGHIVIDTEAVRLPPAPATEPIILVGEPVGENLLSIAKANGVPVYPVQEMINFYESLRPGKNARYWALFDISLHSKEKRLYVLDRISQKVEKYHCAHGAGSDTDNNGIAESFSNINGSGKSSLGFYLVAETYIGKHGISARLDGKSASNSNARARAVVLHGAEYCEDSYVASAGKCGRSLGCPAVPQSVSKELVSKLQNGSVLYIWNGGN